MAFQAPGFSPAEIEAQIADFVGYSVSDATQLTIIDQAITTAAQAACTFDGREWWFLMANATFDTVDGTASYDLRTVNTNAMTDLYVPIGVWRDTSTVRKFNYKDYLDLIRTTDTSSGSPYRYALSGDLTMWLYPTPDDAEEVTVDYLKRHSKITGAGSVAADLIIPAEFQYRIYVLGATWLIKNDIQSMDALKANPEFIECIYNMQAARPDSYDSTGRRYLPSDGVLIYEYGDVIQL